MLERKSKRYTVYTEGLFSATSYVARCERETYKITHCAATVSKATLPAPFLYFQLLYKAFWMEGKLRQPIGVRVRTKVTAGWSRGRFKTLTSEDLPLLSDVPGVQCSSLLGLHGGALVEVLGEVGLVQACDINHLPLGDVVLLHVALDHFGSSPRVLARQISRRLGCWWGKPREKYSPAKYKTHPNISLYLSKWQPWEGRMAKRKQNGRGLDASPVVCSRLSFSFWDRHRRMLIFKPTPTPSHSPPGMPQKLKFLLYSAVFGFQETKRQEPHRKVEVLGPQLAKLIRHGAKWVFQPTLFQSKPLQQVFYFSKGGPVLLKEGWACVPTSWEARSLPKSVWMFKKLFRNLPQSNWDIS